MPQIERKEGESHKFFETSDGEIGVRTSLIDSAGRSSANTVFGENQVGIRHADIAAQFHYGYPTGAANSSTVGSGTISITDALLTVSTGTDSDGHARIINKKALRYIPGHEAYCFFTGVFTQGVANSYQRAGLFNEDDGFFIGYEGTQFTCTIRREGVDENHAIDVSKIFDENYDAFDPTKGNVYKISFGYLGFATITFEVLQPNGAWRVLHKIEYPNTSTVTHITNTNLQPRAEVTNDGNTSDIIFKTGSFTAGIVNGGGSDPASRKFSLDASNQTITAGEDMAIMLRVKSTFNSQTNYIQSLLTFISAASDLSKNSVWEFRKNMTITNTPTWTDVATTDSTIEYSTDATVTSGSGKLGFAFTLGKADKLFEFIDKLESELYPGETLTLIIKTPLGTSGTYDYAVRWKELF